MRHTNRVLAVLSAALGLLLMAAIVPATPASGQSAKAAAPAVGTVRRVAPPPPLTAQQRKVLFGIAKDTWAFFAADVDPTTHLPLDNLGPGATRGTYTSAANIGVYLWSVVSAHDLGLVSATEERSLIRSTLRSVRRLKRTFGFLYQWYDTSNGHVIRNPGDIDCATETTPTQDNCYFLSAVDNGWYASGLIITRQAVPQLAGLVDSLLKPMDFSIFYDDRAQSACNTNAAVDNQPTGQMYGGYYVDQGPAGYHNGALYSDPRIAMYIGMGMHQMPGDVWWRTWRVLPPKQCDTDPDFSWQGQWPVPGYWTTYRDPQSGKDFRVFEGHYVYPGTSLPVHPDVRRRHVRGVDGQRGRPGDQLGYPRVRSRRPAHGRGSAAVCDRRAELPRLGDVAVEYSPTTPVATRRSVPMVRRCRPGRASRCACRPVPCRRTRSRHTHRSSRSTSRRRLRSTTSSRCAGSTRTSTRRTAGSTTR